MVNSVLRHFIDVAHNPTAPPQQLAQQHHSGAHTGGATTARADRPCLFIVKRRVTGAAVARDEGPKPSRMSLTPAGHLRCLALENMSTFLYTSSSFSFGEFDILAF